MNLANNLDFSTALLHLKAGNRVRRAGWNGKGLWIGLVHDHEWTFTNGKWDNYKLLPFIVMKTVDDELVPWLASQTDMLATDWEIVA